MPMYRSGEARDADIAELSKESPATLRDRFLGSTTVIGEWVEELADNLADTTIDRTPGGRQFPASVVVHMRIREVEIHHADLGLDYTAADWPPEFVAMLLQFRVGGVTTARRSSATPPTSTRPGRSAPAVRRCPARAALWHGG